MFSSNGNSCTLSLQSTANHFFDNMAKKFVSNFKQTKTPASICGTTDQAHICNGHTKNLGEPT